MINFKNLDILDKFGQMIMLGLDAYELNDEIIEIIKQYKIGGVIIYKKNYTSINNMIDFINKLKTINQDNKVPLFIAIDQENGRVNRFPKEIERMYNARKQAKTENLNIINGVNKITTYLLKSVGVNMNFAPVIDISNDKDNKSIGDRSYGINKEDVIKYSFPFMECMQQNKIISVVKHFPGHGATKIDSHYTIPYIRNIEKLEKEDLIPFEAAIKKGCDAIMVGHLRLKGYGIKPASLNKKIINELLINKYHFNGLIISDDVKMGLIHYIFGLKHSIISSINAGNDIILIKYKKGDLNRIYKKLIKKLNNYDLDIESINNSAKKIIEIKNKYEINDTQINSLLDIKLINKKIKEINNKIDEELGGNL